jgi:hypothetical protein
MKIESLYEAAEDFFSSGYKAAKKIAKNGLYAAIISAGLAATAYASDVNKKIGEIVSEIVSESVDLEEAKKLMKEFPQISSCIGEFKVSADDKIGKMIEDYEYLEKLKNCLESVSTKAPEASTKTYVSPAIQPETIQKTPVETTQVPSYVQPATEITPKKEKTYVSPATQPKTPQVIPQPSMPREKEKKKIETIQTPYGLAAKYPKDWGILYQKDDCGNGKIRIKGNDKIEKIVLYQIVEDNKIEKIKEGKPGKPLVIELNSLSAESDYKIVGLDENGIIVASYDLGRDVDGFYKKVDDDWIKFCEIKESKTEKPAETLVLTYDGKDLICQLPDGTSVDNPEFYVQIGNEWKPFPEEEIKAFGGNVYCQIRDIKSNELFVPRSCDIGKVKIEVEQKGNQITAEITNNGGCPVIDGTYLSIKHSYSEGASSPLKWFKYGKELKSEEGKKSIRISWWDKFWGADYKAKINPESNTIEVGGFGKYLIGLIGLAALGLGSYLIYRSLKKSGKLENWQEKFGQYIKELKWKGAIKKEISLLDGKIENIKNMLEPELKCELDKNMFDGILNEYKSNLDEIENKVKERKYNEVKDMIGKMKEKLEKMETNISNMTKYDDSIYRKILDKRVKIIFSKDEEIKNLFEKNYSEQKEWCEKYNEFVEKENTEGFEKFAKLERSKLDLIAKYLATEKGVSVKFNENLLTFDVVNFIKENKEKDDEELVEDMLNKFNLEITEEQIKNIKDRLA